MTGRTPAIDDSAAIAARLAELQRERAMALVGCACPETVRGEKLHVASCPLRPQPASQMEMAREAIQRARARANRNQAELPIDDAVRIAWAERSSRPERYVEIIERARAEKAARHRVLT
jgi:hypothetical protein